MELIEKIQDEVNKLAALAPMIPLVVLGPYDLWKKDTDGAPYWMNHYNDIFKYLHGYKQAGVYIIANAKADGFYIGSSAGGGGSIGKRLWDEHFGREKDYREDKKTLGAEEAARKMFDAKSNQSGHFTNVQFLIVLPVPERVRWFATALEAYLIEKLEPKWNIKGKK